MADAEGKGHRWAFSFLSQSRTQNQQPFPGSSSQPFLFICFVWSFSCRSKYRCVTWPNTNQLTRTACQTSHFDLNFCIWVSVFSTVSQKPQLVLLWIPESQVGTNIASWDIHKREQNTGLETRHKKSREESKSYGGGDPHGTKQSLETEQSSCLDTRNFSETFPLGRNGRSKKWLNRLKT